MAKPTTKEIIQAVTEIRSYNNQRWMSLLELAITARPKRAKEIIRVIIANDKEITEWISKL
jgi:hypothetical protein